MNWEAVIAITAVVELLATIIMGVALYVMARRASVRDAEVARSNMVRDAEASAQTARVDALEKNIGDKAEKLIAQQFQLAGAKFDSDVSKVAMKLESATAQFSMMVAQINDRLENGDDKFDEQGDKLNKHQLWAMAAFGTKAEMAALVEQVQQVRVSLAGVSAELQSIKGQRHK